MLISGWEAVDGRWCSLGPIACVLQYMFMSGTTFPYARFPEFGSLSTLTQAVLEMIAPLLSDWPAWHSKGASSSSWAFSIWRWYCPVKETDREINHLCDTLCCDKDTLMKNMLGGKKSHTVKLSCTHNTAWRWRAPPAAPHFVFVDFLQRLNDEQFQLRKFAKINNKHSLFGGILVFQFQDGDLISCFLGCLI